MKAAIAAAVATYVSCRKTAEDSARLRQHWLPRSTNLVAAGFRTKVVASKNMASAPAENAKHGTDVLDPILKAIFADGDADVEKPWFQGYPGNFKYAGFGPGVPEFHGGIRIILRGSAKFIFVDGTDISEDNLRHLGAHTTPTAGKTLVARATELLLSSDVPSDISKRATDHNIKMYSLTVAAEPATPQILVTPPGFLTVQTAVNGGLVSELFLPYTRKNGFGVQAVEKLMEPGVAKLALLKALRKADE